MPSTTRPPYPRQARAWSCPSFAYPTAPPSKPHAGQTPKGPPASKREPPSIPSGVSAAPSAALSIAEHATRVAPARTNGSMRCANPVCTATGSLRRPHVPPQDRFADPCTATGSLRSCADARFRALAPPRLLGARRNRSCHGAWLAKPILSQGMARETDPVTGHGSRK